MFLSHERDEALTHSAGGGLGSRMVRERSWTRKASAVGSPLYGMSRIGKLCRDRGRLVVSWGVGGRVVDGLEVMAKAGGVSLGNNAKVLKLTAVLSAYICKYTKSH